MNFDNKDLQQDIQEVHKYEVDVRYYINKYINTKEDTWNHKSRDHLVVKKMDLVFDLILVHSILVASKCKVLDEFIFITELFTSIDRFCILAESSSVGSKENIN